MVLSQLVAEQKFSMMQQELIEIIKILTATINKLKAQYSSSHTGEVQNF